ncbi:DNA-binding protein inhibitor ID-2-like [Daphnia pulicaria]|uniref:DNA-binding protein inhibitor ID-2-like n=1 Tax=Daphnia pulicaria TaxID=35523 RepID=UPI001EEA9C87|nr:DNA-binding protein inhibitor ID-2-like [Daphnia pulicaria]
MVKASNRHPTSSTTTSSTATVQQQQQSDPLRGVMATSKEQVEIQMYLSKLKELVPHMPKNRKVSKLEVIQHVIDYICDLQSELEQNHPASLNRNRRKQHSAAVLAARRATTDASVIASGASLSHPSAASSAVHRQPLGLLTSIPNTSIEVNNTTGDNKSISDVIVPC